MDDMKKLIERYKKELLEMSRKNGKEASDFVSPSVTASVEKRKPQIIGYVGEDAEIDKILDEIAEKKDEKKEDEEGCLESENDENNDFPDEIFGKTGEDDEDENDGDEDLYEPPVSGGEEVCEDDKNGEDDDDELTDMPVFKAPKGIENERESPISGEDYDEQISKNSQDEGEGQGSRTDAEEFSETVYESYADFERENAGEGTMLFRVFTAREALPVADARVEITKNIGGKSHLFYSLTTDASGKTFAEKLPAPVKELSLESGNKIQPFSLYDAVVTKEGYAAAELFKIPVFDGISSVQKVAMAPAGNFDISEEFTEVEEDGEQ